MKLPENPRDGLDYCLVCGADRASAHRSIVQHVRVQHLKELDGADPEEGVHWASAWQAQLMIERQEIDVLRFTRNMQSLRGADDFLLEAGGA